MKFKIFSFIVGIAILAAFSVNANAQYMTQDLIFIKFGYIPLYNVSFEEEDMDDSELKGFAVQGEYNLNFSGFWLGFGLEYQYMTEDSTGEDLNYSFLLPAASIKVAAVGGLYLGGGVAGKYLLTADEIASGVEFKKTIDLWVNGILGYHMPIAEGVFLDLEGRFGWNLTNRQFSEMETPGGVSEIETNNSYDFGFYAGIGFRAPGSNY
jgi:hypothetical protein